jgi:gamma-glutamylcyclotransferase
MSLPVVGKAHEARAGTAPFRWFIYGSSLDAAAFAVWAEQHGYRVPDLSTAVPAALPDHRLAFDVPSKFWGGAVATVTAAPGSAVEGIALPMPAEARGLVDHKEGDISGLFEPFLAEVRPLDGSPALPALVYRAAAARRLAAEAAPSPGFLDALIAGARAHRLSAPWIAQLEEARSR